MPRSGKLFQDLAVDDELGPKFRKANTIVRYEYPSPDSAITVRLQEDQPGDVDFGESQMEPEVTMTMAADTAHRFWLGQVNITVALARGQIKAKGPVAKILKLVPLAKPVSPATRRSWRRRAATDLINVSRPEGAGRVSAGDEQQAWAETVKRLAAARGLRYDPIGGLNPGAARRRSARAAPTG